MKLGAVLLFLTLFLGPRPVAGELKPLSDEELDQATAATRSTEADMNPVDDPPTVIPPRLTDPPSAQRSQPVLPQPGASNLLQGILQSNTIFQGR